MFNFHNGLKRFSKRERGFFIERPKIPSCMIYKLGFLINLGVAKCHQNSFCKHEFSQYSCFPRYYTTRKNPPPTSIQQLINLELCRQIQYPRDYKRFFKQIENVSDFRDKVSASSQLIFSYHVDPALYTKFWKGMISGISTVNDIEVHEEFVQLFRYLHNNHLWILEPDVIQKWFHYLATRQLTVLIAAQFERLVSPSSFIASKEHLIHDFATIPSSDVLEKRILNAEFLGLFFKHLYDSSHGSHIGSRYIAKYFKQYCMNPNRRPYVAPKNNFIILNGLRATKALVNEHDFIPLVKHFLSFLEVEKLTPLQIDSLAIILNNFIQEKPEEYATFLVSIYESTLRHSPLVLQNPDFLHCLMVAYSQMGRYEIAAHLFGISLTRSMIGGLPKENQPSNILIEVEKWLNQHPNATTLELQRWAQRLCSTQNLSMNPDFTLQLNKQIFEKAIRCFTILEKWTLIRFIFEKYIESSKGFLDRKIAGTTLSGYILNGRMKEAVSFYAQYYRGQTDSLCTVAPTSKEIIKMMDGFIKQGDTKRAIKFFEACMTATPECLNNPSREEGKHLYRVLNTICSKDPSISQNVRKILKYYSKYSNL